MPRSMPLVAASAVCAAAAALIAGALLGGATRGLDLWARAAATELRTPWMLEVAHALAFLGGEHGATVAIALLILALLLARRPAVAFALALASLGALAVSETVKATVDRARPADALVEVAGASFPSGHSMAAAAAAVVLAVGTARAWAVVLALLWMLLMAASRVILGVHWLSDVAAGLLLGTAIALLACALSGALARIGGRGRDRDGRGRGGDGRGGRERDRARGRRGGRDDDHLGIEALSLR